MKGALLKFYSNIPNIVSILGVLPLAILFVENGFDYIIPLIIFNNLMDDLDGILARELNLRSDYGARMDNLADSIAHTLIILVVSSHYGNLVLLFGLLPISAFMIRSVSRLGSNKDGGSATNELIRHIMFTLILAQFVSFDTALVLIVLFVLHTITMLWELPMPYMIRSMTKSPVAIFFVNISLVIAWLIPDSVPYIGGAFVATYLYSMVLAPIRSGN